MKKRKSVDPRPGPAVDLPVVEARAIIWECDHMDLYRYLWIYEDIYMDFGYHFCFLTGHIHIWIYIDIHMKILSMWISMIFK